MKIFTAQSDINTLELFKEKTPEACLRDAKRELKKKLIDKVIDSFDLLPIEIRNYGSPDDVTSCLYRAYMIFQSKSEYMKKERERLDLIDKTARLEETLRKTLLELEASRKLITTVISDPHFKKLINKKPRGVAV